MEYMFLINVDETQGPPGDPSADGFEEMMAGWFAYNQMLTEGGHFVAGASLQPSATATVVHNGTGAVTDGPYVETKELLGGFVILETETEDEALAIAKDWPSLSTQANATVHLQPVFVRD